MKTNQFQQFLLIFISIMILSSCDNDSKTMDDVIPVTKSELLTNGDSKTWKVISITSDPPFPAGNTVITDIYAQRDNCDRDDLFAFKVDGNYIFDEGDTKCESNDSQVFEKGTWSFNINETVISFDPTDDGSYEWELESLEENELSYKRIRTRDNINYSWIYVLEAE